MFHAFATGSHLLKALISAASNKNSQKLNALTSLFTLPTKSPSKHYVFTASRGGRALTPALPLVYSFKKNFHSTTPWAL